MLTLIPDRQFWKQGPLVASPGTWGANHLLASQYENRLLVGDDGHLLFTWDFPKERSPVGIYAYDYIAQGRYWQEAGDTPVAPIKCGAVKGFRVDFTVWLAGVANLLLEYFVTASPGDINTRQSEVAWFPYLPAESRPFFDAGKLIGHYKSIAGSSWEVRQQMSNGCPNGYLMIVRSSDASPIFNAQMDCLSGHRFLLEKGLIDPAHYINGVALGAEAVTGPGAMHLSRFKVALG